MSDVLIAYQTNSRKYFFVANDFLHHSQYCMKYCSKKTLTHVEILFNYCLSRNRCVAKKYLEYGLVDLRYLQAGLP